MCKVNKGLLFSKLMLVLVSLNLASCATGLVAGGAGATAYVANQESTLTQQAKDVHIKANIADEIVRRKLGYLKDIEVNVVNGEVLLIGIVQSSSEKRRLQDIALNASPYVKRIHNYISVRYSYPVTSYLNDSFIANMIRTRLIASKETYLSKVDVEVFNNVVYIFGVVSNIQEKRAAEQIARTGKGVRSVNSFIAVKVFPKKFR